MSDAPPPPPLPSVETVDELRRLEQAAKCAPWRLEFDNQDVRLVSPDDPEIANWTFLVRPWMPGDWDDCDLSDQHLIVAMRNALPALLAERDALAGQVTRLEAVREAAATLVTSMRDGWFPEDPPHTGSFIQRQYVDALRAALAGADGQEAG